MSDPVPLAAISVPRTARFVNRRGMDGFLLVINYVLGPLLCIAILLLGTVFVTVVIVTAYLGTDVAGQVVDRQVIMEGKKRNYATYRVIASVEYEGRSETHSETVSEAGYKATRIGTPVTLRVHVFGPFLYAMLPREVPDRDMFLLFSLMCLPGLLMVLGTLVVTGSRSLYYLRSRRLVQIGLVTTGTVVEKKARGTQVSYVFVSSEGQTRGTMRIPQSSSAGVLEGQQVQVVYDAEKPARSVLYDYADFEAVPG